MVEAVAVVVHVVRTEVTVEARVDTVVVETIEVVTETTDTAAMGAIVVAAEATETTALTVVARGVTEDAAEEALGAIVEMIVPKYRLRIASNG